MNTEPVREILAHVDKYGMPSVLDPDPPAPKHSRFHEAMELFTGVLVGSDETLPARHIAHHAALAEWLQPHTDVDPPPIPARASTIGWDGHDLRHLWELEAARNVLDQQEAE